MSESKQSMEQLIEKYKQELVQYGMKTPSGGQVPAEKPIEIKTVSLTPAPPEQREEVKDIQLPEQEPVKNMPEVQEMQEIPCIEPVQEDIHTDETESVQTIAEVQDTQGNTDEEGTIVIIEEEPEAETPFALFELSKEEEETENRNAVPEKEAQAMEDVVEIAPRRIHMQTQNTNQEPRIVQPEAMRMRQFPPDVVKLALDKSSSPQAHESVPRVRALEAIPQNPGTPSENQSGGVEKYGWMPGKTPQEMTPKPKERETAENSPRIREERAAEQTQAAQEVMPEEAFVQEEQERKHCSSQSPQQMAGEEKSYTGSGALKVQVFAAQGVYPVSGARVAVFRAHNGRNLLLYDNVSDDNGFVQGLILPAPSAEDTGERAFGERPFANYSVFVEHPGYLRAVFRNIAVYDGVESIKPVFLIPQSTGMKQPPPIEF